MEDIKKAISPVVFINESEPVKNSHYGNMMHTYPFINAMYLGLPDIEKDDHLCASQINSSINYFANNNCRDTIIIYLLKFGEEYNLWNADDVVHFVQNCNIYSFIPSLVLPNIQPLNDKSELLDNYLITYFQIPYFNGFCKLFEDFIDHISAKYVLSSASYNNDLFGKIIKLTFGENFDYCPKDPSYKYEFTCNKLREMCSKYLLVDIKKALNLMSDSIKNMILLYLNSANKSENEMKQIMAGLMIESKGV